MWARVRMPKTAAVCFEMLAMKATAWPGDHLDAEFYRRKAFASCGVDPYARADTALIEVHGRGRKTWSNSTELAALVKTRLQLPGIRVRVTDFERLSFCAQVKEFASAQIALQPHGAAIAANTMFMKPEDGGIVFEIVPPESRLQRRKRVTCNTGELSDSYGLRLVTVPAALPVRHGSCNGKCKSYATCGHCRFDIDAELLGEYLAGAGDVLHWAARKAWAARKLRLAHVAGISTNKTASDPRCFEPSSTDDMMITWSRMATEIMRSGNMRHATGNGSADGGPMPETESENEDEVINNTAIEDGQQRDRRARRRHRRRLRR